MESTQFIGRLERHEVNVLGLLVELHTRHAYRIQSAREGIKKGESRKSERLIASSSNWLKRFETDVSLPVRDGEIMQQIQAVADDQRILLDSLLVRLDTATPIVSLTRIDTIREAMHETFRFALAELLNSLGIMDADYLRLEEAAWRAYEVRFPRLEPMDEGFGD